MTGEQCCADHRNRPAGRSSVNFGWNENHRRLASTIDPIGSVVVRTGWPDEIAPPDLAHTDSTDRIAGPNAGSRFGRIDTGLTLGRRIVRNSADLVPEPVHRLEAYQGPPGRLARDQVKRKYRSS